MKTKTFKSFLIAILAAMLPQLAGAYDFMVDGLCYNYNEDGTSVTVTYQKQLPPSLSGSTYLNLSGALNIPSNVTYNGTTYSVTEIGVWAFRNCDGLTSVTIPNSVTSIGSQAFYSCNGLTSVTIGNSVTSIPYECFCYCDGLTSVTIGNSVTSIDVRAFYSCRGLTSIEIPKSVTSIGDQAFLYTCSSFINSGIEDPSVVEMGTNVFDVNTHKLFVPKGTSSIYKQTEQWKDFSIIIEDVIFVNNFWYKKNEDGISVSLVDGSFQSNDISIPSSIIYDENTFFVSTIDDYAFNGCSSLTSVTIPNLVTSIGNSAFSGCSGLTSVTIPNSVTSIGEGAFSDCSGLTSVVIPNSVTSIGDQAFYSCNGLTSVTIPSSVTKIGTYTFSYCSGLTSVTIPNSVTSIGDNAFYGCSGLTSVTIPNSVTSIGKYAFSGCTGLTSLTIPNSVTEIGESAFTACSGLTSIVVERGNAIYDSRNNCDAIIKTETHTLIYGCMSTIIPNSVTSIGKYAFSGCTGLTSLTIPNSVTWIDNYAFSGCSGLTSVTIPNSVTSIGKYAFSGCTGLTSLTIPNSVTWIDNYAFYGCSGLTSLTIPNSVEYVQKYAFNNCSSLTSLTLLGKGGWYNSSSKLKGLEDIAYMFKIVNIGMEINYLFGFNFNPNVINCYAETPPGCNAAFNNYDAELHVPTTSIASYFMDDYWQNFNIVNNLGKVTLNKDSVSLDYSETITLIPTVTLEGDEVFWSSTNPSVATVDENGVVTATGGGNCDIYATLASSNGAAYAKCHVISSGPEITLSLSEESLNMNIGENNTINATVIPDNTGLFPTWISSNNNIAKVTAYGGMVTAVGEGECDIIATVHDKTAICHVTVTNNVTITLNVDNAIIGASQILTVYPSCSPDVPVELVVTSSDPSVAVTRVVNRTNAPAAGLMSFPEKDMALALMEELAVPSESKDPALASTKAVTIVGVQNGTATITVTTADGKAVPAVLELRVVDVDGDRTITATDITCLYNYLLNGDETFITTSDTNGDGFITSTDITVLYNLMLGN